MLIAEAATGGADLVALPEYLEFMGPASERSVVARPVPGPVSERLAHAAAGHGVWTLAGGILEANGGKVHDTSLLFDRVGRARRSLPQDPPVRRVASRSTADP